MEKLLNAIFEHISKLFENLKPETKGFLLICFGLLYGCSYWLSSHNEFKNLRSIMLYLSITIIVLLLIDLNNFWKTKNDIKKTKEDLAKLNFGQIYQLHECINENDPIIRIPDNADYYVTENLNLLEARSYITTVGTNLYKIPDNTFELLKNVDFEEFGIKKEAPEELGY